MSSFWVELQRRNVYKVAAAYAVFVWLIVQIASIVFPAFEIANWVMQALLVVAAIGFPVTVVLAWIYDLTPEGIRRTDDVTEALPGQKLTGRKLDFVIIGVLILAIGFLVTEKYLYRGAPVLSNSVAVLPFENLSDDPGNAYFAAGVHDTILNELARIKDMNVIARTSVLRYADGQTPLPEIAEELNVGAIMEGTVQYTDRRVRITAQLIDPVSGMHLWSANYDRTLNDIFAIQTDIAKQIALAVDAKLSEAEQESMAQQATDSVEAYTLYLKANEIYRQMGNRSDRRREAMFYLAQAIELDDGFALAYALRAWYLANAITDTFAGSADPAERDAQERMAREDAEKALALDPNLGLAFLALATIERAYWRWTEAQTAFRQARRLSPSDTTVLIEYAWFESFIGNYAEAMAVADRATALDPHSSRVHVITGAIYGYAGDNETAIRHVRDAIRLAPMNRLAHLWLGHIEGVMGNQAYAESALRASESLHIGTESPLAISALAYAYSRNNLQEDANRLLGDFDARISERPTDAGSRVVAALALGDRDTALTWLREAAERTTRHEIDDGAFNLMMLKANIYSDPMLQEAPFPSLLAGIGVLN